MAPPPAIERVVARQVQTLWTERFLGVGYKRGGQGPDVYDCWSFFRWVQRERFGRDVPFMPTPASRGSIARAMPEWAAEFGWRRLADEEARETGDAVFMANMLHPTHVGVWVADLPEWAVLHCPEGGAALHRRAHLDMARWRLHAFYRFAGAA